MAELHPEQADGSAGVLAAAGKLPRPIWALGLTSLLMDASSEAIQSLMPVFLVSVLGATPQMLGLIEGVGEAVTSATKPLAGYFSDRWRDRKRLTLLGYGLAAASKPFFALASSAGWVLGARAVDRLGKGIRGAPRDALIADIVDPSLRGAAFGLRQALDTVGAFVGPVAAIALMTLGGFDLRAVFWLAVLPAVASVLVLGLGVAEPARKTADKSRPSISLRRFGAAFWLVCAIGAALTLARFSEAFMVLRAQETGLAVAWIPLVFVVMNMVYAAGAYPIGALSDRMSPAILLALGGAVLVVADAVLAVAQTVPMVMVGVAIWGAHMALTQGVLAAMVAAAAPAEARASAFGVFTFMTAIATLLSNTAAGWIWEARGPAVTFIAGGCLAAAAGLGAFLIRRRLGETKSR